MVYRAYFAAPKMAQRDWTSPIELENLRHARHRRFELGGSVGGEGGCEYRFFAMREGVTSVNLKRKQV